MKDKIKLTEKFLSAHNLDPELINNIPENDRIIKRINTELEIKAEPEGIVRGIFSTIDTDSDGDIVIPTGLDFSRYDLNSIILFNHDLDDPIASMTNKYVTADRFGGSIKFSKEPKSQKIYQLMADGVLKTFSIGFITLEAVYKNSPEFRPLFNKISMQFPGRFDIETVNRIITKSLLVETSVVSIPANKNAVALEIKSIENSIENKDEKQDENKSDIQERTNEYKSEIKLISKASTINKISSIEEENQKRLKEMYIQLWGI